MKLLVSYRRADTAGTAGRIFDRLAARYGRQSIFIDVDNIPLGRDFRTHIREFIESCEVVLLVIGPRWTGLRDGATARMHDQDDPVRIEAELALQRRAHVIPLLVDGAEIPRANDLPESLAELPFLNAARVDSGVDFHHHMDRLIKRVDEVTGEAPEAARIVPAASVTAVWGVVIAAAAAMPLALSLARMSPPWPPGIVVVTTIVVAASLAVFLQLLKESALKRVRHVTFASTLLLLVIGCTYPVATSLFTYETPATRERWVKGFACTPEARTLFGEKCPFLGTDELRSAEYEAERLWTGSSVAAAKSALVVLWLAGFIALSSLTAALLVLHSRTASPKPRSTRAAF